MEITRVIKSPVLTEKSNDALGKNVYTFEVDWAANKFQIKRAVEFIFKVKVLSVNTLKVDKQPKSLGRYHGFTNKYKKAFVKLAEGYTISFYPQEEEKQDKAKVEKEKAEAAKAEKEKTAEKEAKLAEKIAAKKAKKSSVAKEKEEK
ncbi:50S ribosomal protein L23 [Mycoplasmopsis bovis]|uniref:Large ribosomal subunit protein uL23 n=3 Tax=Mycoplasmopsis bovis TaxID=28903 RepID=A0A059Y4M0_MYCBV|nr:50S ribosomal protein L23 [Mycoplasmopsis bovis]ADR24945.1 ribosomal protein L23 [Mycoplasmopsis bovis PG45]AEI90298.1 50S ribosomal protein L23 [Mycoplasmopsis bovis Hubei-1]AFM51978.1 50S ribosomal protein [Mycoplasmopsis bovis HB0801]AIA34163.1 50S ribosomal protein L23 [Mycoplasmopsis bovis CQ-W70]AKO50779.1 50S ribosomal protein L23 [Mycoplasmopsis bovis]